VIIVTGPNPDNETYTVTLQPGAGKWKQLGLEVVMDENLPGLRVARGADRLLITELEVEAGGRKIPFVTGMANLNNQAPEYLPAGAIDGDPKTDGPSTRTPKPLRLTWNCDLPSLWKHPPIPC
jgi:hypothetical protein